VADEPVVECFPLGTSPNLEGPPTAVVTHRGLRLELHFAPGDVQGTGALQELRVLPGTDDLEPRALRRFAPDSEVYLAYARAAMRIFGPEGTTEERWESFRDAAQTLRRLGGPGRGLPDEFFKTIATHYRALVDGGEPHPVKALAKTNCVTIGAASRWVTEARRRGLLPEKTKRTTDG